LLPLLLFFVVKEQGGSLAAALQMPPTAAEAFATHHPALDIEGKFARYRKTWPQVGASYT
jgi:hypothetical protein